MEKNLEIIKIIFLISINKNNKTYFQKKSFSVFGGALGRPQNTLKLFLQFFFIIFCTLMKNTFAIISRFFSQQICWYYLAMFFSLTIIHFKMSITKDYFLIQKIPKVTKLKKGRQKNPE